MHLLRNKGMHVASFVSPLNRKGTSIMDYCTTCCHFYAAGSHLTNWNDIGPNESENYTFDNQRVSYLILLIDRQPMKHYENHLDLKIEIKNQKNLWFTIDWFFGRIVSWNHRWTGRRCSTYSNKIWLKIFDNKCF